MFFFDNFKSDCILRTIVMLSNRISAILEDQETCLMSTMFLSKLDVVKSVWQAFENYVTV